MEWSGRWSIIFCKQNATQDSAKVAMLKPVTLRDAVTKMFFEKLSCDLSNMCMTKNVSDQILAFDNAVIMKKEQSFLCFSSFSLTRCCFILNILYVVSVDQGRSGSRMRRGMKPVILLVMKSNIGYLSS